jgi:hypothetical protein
MFGHLFGTRPKAPAQHVCTHSAMLRLLFALMIPFASASVYELTESNFDRLVFGNGKRTAPAFIKCVQKTVPYTFLLSPRVLAITPAWI